jgi:glycosyltransferase involved in cell wall biosynthesis
VHNAVPHEEGRRDASEHRRWRAADALVVHGEQAEGTVRQVAPEAVVRVIPVDLLGHRPPVAKAEARARLRLGDDPAAVALGLVRPYKGFDLLAGAWPRVRAAVPTARLFVVGAAPRSFDALDELCALPGVERRDGWIDDDEFEQWAAAADVAVLPYRHGVHSGVLHRAVSNGTPVLASPPLREEVERYQAGRVVPLEVAEWASALATALGGDPLPPPSPPPESQARKHAELYRELLAARRPTAAAHEAMEVGG